MRRRSGRVGFFLRGDPSQQHTSRYLFFSHQPKLDARPRIERIPESKALGGDGRVEAPDQHGVVPDVYLSLEMRGVNFSWTQNGRHQPVNKWWHRGASCATNLLRFPVPNLFFIADQGNHQKTNI